MVEKVKEVPVKTGYVERIVEIEKLVHPLEASITVGVKCPRSTSD